MKVFQGVDNVTSHQVPRRIKNIKHLRKLLSDDEDGLEKFVYPNLRLGDIWWIPDSLTKFGDGDCHPWVIVGPYSPKRPNVFAAPRTTRNFNKKKGIITPAGNPPGLNQIGIILLNLKRPFLAKDFRDFDYAGRLSEDIINQIVSHYRFGHSR